MPVPVKSGGTPERLFTVAKAAEVLCTTERFPRRLIAERRIRFTRIAARGAT
jgi:excisionase family DNA binding protein